MAETKLARCRHWDVAYLVMMVVVVGIHADVDKHQDYHFKYFASSSKIFCAEILARVLTDGADATVVAEIHSWIEYFEFLD